MNSTDKILKNIENFDLQELFNQSINNPDPEKRKVFNSLYNYVLDKKQDMIIKKEHFVI
ncbi:hypothetical protein MOO44_08615 [Nicoliella spurrieriana]|uniref:Uncharacterized protein n=1 Tax=Nicoliella spurrieriana TaxID=2925830 RepID=A0A976X5H3_9LACO|nr:hypothetical protein [Nicoliella spurrieriana]UQS86910.1 hypothetical protein MOO44_08615 [Nicoliella spurrieriana]